MSGKEKDNQKAKATHSFQAETKELLNLMVNSLYTHREIFLRELISNASDAIDKTKFHSLTNPEMLESDESEFTITMDVNREAGTLLISDNGIGMSYQEVIDNIGTIARSGSKSFLENLQQNENKDVELIGKFGVGFYSAFMVAERVTLTTRAPGEAKGVRWESEGDGSYTIEEVEKEKRGTDIILHLRENCTDKDKPEEDFLNPYTIRNLVEKYSNYIIYPIKMDFIREEKPRDKEGKVIEDAEPQTVIENKTLNSMTPIWEKDKRKITDDEYFQFYKHHFHDWNDLADVIHVKAEGKVQYTALLFIPSRAPSNLYDKNYSDGIQLYSNHVFVMKDCKDLLPDHLRFVRGLVDSPDFSLNISREILQHDDQLKIIGKNLEKKVLKALEKLMQKERKKYEELWDQMGKALKGGIYMKYKNKESLQDLLLFSSSKSGEGMATLKEYVERMPEGQKEIFYATGKDVDTIHRMPQMEIFREKDVEILYFVDKIDEFLTQNLDEYDGKKLKSVIREDFNIDDIIPADKNKDKEKKDEDKKEEDKPKDEVQELEEQNKELLGLIQKNLGEKVKGVNLSHRLKSSPVCLVTTSSGVTFNMEQLLQSANQITPKAGKILEINPKHKIFTVLQTIFNTDKDSEKMKDYSEVLYSQAMLIEGYELEDPAEFSRRLTNLMVEAHETTGN